MSNNISFLFIILNKKDIYLNLPKMNAMKLCIKIFVCIVIINFILFILLIFFSMSDEGGNLVATLCYKILRYICSFPLIIFNRDWPYYLDDKSLPNDFAILVISNIILQEICIFIFLYMINKIRNR